MENYFEDFEANKAINEIIKINKIRRIPKNEAKKELLIGKGTQSIVFSGVYKNEEVAIKYLLNADWKSLAHELVIVSCIRHESLPLFYGFIYDNDSFALVFERIYGSCLDQINLNKITEENKISILRQLCFLLESLHKKNIIHRDLKPENIILDPDFNKMYLIDYGISRVLIKDSFTETIAKGTINYMAPECFESSSFSSNDFDNINNNQNNNPNNNIIISKITTKVDVWGFGCIISYLFSKGIIPWTVKNNINDPNILKSIKNKKTFPIPDNIDNKNVIKVIELATIIDIDERATMKEICEYVKVNL
jgi:serine/threonine protein kinase